MALMKVYRIHFAILFPRSGIAQTPIPCDLETPGGVELRHAIPEIRAYNANGEEIHCLDADMSPVIRLMADWPATVVMASAVLSAAQNKVVTREELLRLNEQSPETYHHLKESVALYKAHFNRLLDPVAGRRDPKFQEVAARYKEEIRSLAAKKEEAAMRLREVSRELERRLAARDEELSRLDPGYKQKHVTAAAVGLDTRRKKRRRH
ncbi:hypothetical protein V1525DRAFT_430238 [Lipomyces kononenkoae]|uniref:Uncharacterized protein n=1 Tax=Lipomyces kononenkoae TaxID=34357 RepID=A0ACC3T8G4_LIPKO